MVYLRWSTNGLYAMPALMMKGHCIIKGAEHEEKNQ